MDEIISKIQTASFDKLVDALTIATTACFYQTLKILDVDIDKVDKIDKISLVNAIKEEIKKRYNGPVY